MNLLLNPEFEETTLVVAVSGGDEFSLFRVPRDWQGGALTSLSPMRWVNRIPAGKAGGKRVHGERSFQMYCEDGTFTAWVYQRVAVTPGTPLTGGAQAFIEGASGSVARVGIDPNGGENPYAAGVIWSPWATALNAWTPRSVSCTAGGEFATLFLYGTQMAFKDPNGVFWDSAYADGTPGNGTGWVTLEFELGFNLRFRGGPGANFPELTRIPRGTVLIATGRTDDGLWIKAEYEGVEGWLPTQYGTLTGDIKRLPVAAIG